MNKPVSALVLVIAAAGAGWWVLGNGSALQVAVPVHGPAVEAVYATGTVESTVMYPVAPRVSGRLVALMADERDTVTTGQALARLESAEAAANLEQLRAKEAYAAVAFKRAKGLLAENTASRATYDNAEADLKAARAAREAAEAQLSYTELTAPQDATVIYRDGEVGQLIAANQTVFWLASGGQLRLSAQVDEEDIARVKAGQEVLVRADAFGSKVFKGTVDSITPKGDPVARSFRVRIGLPEDTPLQIGMTAEVNIILREADDALLIPTSAVRDGAVWAVTDGKLHLQPVATGAVGASQTEVLDGLGADTQVVVHPTAALKEGKRVRVRMP